MSGATNGDHPALQDSSGTEASPRAVELAATILSGAVSVDAAIESAGRHLLAEPRVDVAVAVLTNFVPEDDSFWTGLGERAWIREWTSGEGTQSVVPSEGGAEGALTMPWVSPRARVDVVALTDRDLLPPEAAQDRRELTALGLRGLVGSAFISDGVMYGSMSVASLEAGPWPPVLIADMRLLKAAITSRLALEHSRRALAEAIEAGTEAQLGYQHFFGAVGHELRTPLAAVLGHTEALVGDAGQDPDHPLAASILRDGRVIVRACERLISVVDSLLGAGRTLSGDDDRQDVVLADAVADVVHWHRVPARTARVEVHVDVPPSATAWAHPAGVRQVLTNLLSNAVAHHHPTGGTVHVSVEPLLGESGQEMVRIVVRDDGPGLTADQLGRAFDPFVRFPGRRTKGSGLGLSVARTIAERDGGAVRGESTPGVGSSFWLELPAVRPLRP